jgi:DeoR/GlpR family transcriptional regulator of sugar metabolism
MCGLVRGATERIRPGLGEERELAMLARLRRRQILDVLRARGGVRLTELSEALSVSEVTIRRDLDALQKDGLIERVHGGAVLSQVGAEEPGFEKKALREQREKAAIAERAAALVKPGSAVALSAGTTTWALASRLSHCEGLRSPLLIDSERTR